MKSYKTRKYFILNYFKLLNQIILSNKTEKKQKKEKKEKKRGEKEDVIGLEVN
jgi:hypothetical protein